MKRKNKLYDRKIRSIISNKILNNNEAISISEVDNYIEKQGVSTKYEIVRKWN